MTDDERISRADAYQRWFKLNALSERLDTGRASRTDLRAAGFRSRQELNRAEQEAESAYLRFGED